MKKFYLLSAIALSTSFLSAQVLQSENFDALVIGDVGTSTTFGSPGQGGIYTNGGANADYQIVAIDAGHGKSLQMSSGNAAVATSNRQAVKPGLGTAWGTRTVGNNILQAKFEIYTGTSTGSTRVGANVTSATAGILGLHYNSETKTLNGQANITPSAGGASGFYNITGITANVYPANTWISVSFTYDSVNGAITYTIDGVKTTLEIAGYVVTKNLVPSQYNLINQVTANNTVVNSGSIDNYVVSAENDITLGTGESVKAGGKLSVYPNPVKDVLNFKMANNLKVESTELYDMAGKKVNTVNGKAIESINVANFPKGTYILKVKANDGNVYTQKILKK